MITEEARKLICLQVQIDQPEDLKRQASPHYNAGDLEQALSTYHKCRSYTDGIYDPTERNWPVIIAALIWQQADPWDIAPSSLRTRRRMLKWTTGFNIAACYLKQYEYERCGRLCTAMIREFHSDGSVNKLLAEKDLDLGMNQRL